MKPVNIVLYSTFILDMSNTAEWRYAAEQKFHSLSARYSIAHLLDQGIDDAGVQHALFLLRCVNSPCMVQSIETSVTALRSPGIGGAAKHLLGFESGSRLGFPINSKFFLDIEKASKLYRLVEPEPGKPLTDPLIAALLHRKTVEAQNYCGA